MEDCLTSSIVFCHCFAIASATPHSLRVLVDSLPQVRIPAAPVRLLHTLQPALAMNPDLQDAKVIQVDLSDMSEPLGHQKSFPCFCSLSGVVAGSGCRFRMPVPQSGWRGRDFPVAVTDGPCVWRKLSFYRNP